MNRDVIVTVRGLQIEEGTEDPIEVEAPGWYRKRDDHHFVCFDEYVQGGELIRNIIKIYPKRVEVTKRGAVQLQLLFEPGERYVGIYTTPFGQLEMGISTEQICLNEEKERLELELEYHMEINNELIGNNELHLVVQSIPHAQS